MLLDEGLDLIEQAGVGEQLFHGCTNYDKFPTVQAKRLEIYQMAGGFTPCDIFPMPAKPDKKAEAERSAREIYRKLMALPRPLELTSNNALTERAGVSSSFFTNLKGKFEGGKEVKAPSDPSVSNLRQVLRAIDVTLPEFFLDEAGGKVARVPTKRELERALADVWEELPRGKDKQIAYVAANVLRALGLPQADPASSAAAADGGSVARAK